MTTDANHSCRHRLAGIAGIVGALLWTIGDALIIGERADAADHRLMMETYADRIDFEALAMMLPASEPRLAAGALIADIGVVFYLAGSWHIFRALRSAGPWTAWPIFALMICGNAWSPLGHAGFYYVGMVYKTVPDVPEAAHGALLDLGARFHAVLMIAWLLPVVSLAIALLLLGIAIACGRTAYPRWMAAVLNPVSLVAIGIGVPLLMPDPARTWLDGAAFNIGWLVAYALSTAVLWNSDKTGRSAPAAWRRRP